MRLDAICSELFRDIDQDTVDFVDNYDGKMKEPTLLPTTFPNVLVSANQGIAVGMASNLCGFNLGEVCDTTIAYFKNPEHDLMTTLKAPDLPTGGELLYDEAALSDIYRTGRGSFKVRSKWRYIKSENLIEVYEIPYSTTTEVIIDKVTELVKGGKPRRSADMRDETDLSGPEADHRPEAGNRPGQAHGQALPLHPPAGQPVLQLQHPHRRHAPGDGRAGDSGGVDGLAHGIGAPAHLSSP